MATTTTTNKKQTIETADTALHNVGTAQTVVGSRAGHRRQTQRSAQRSEYITLSDMYFELAGRVLSAGMRDLAQHALELSSEYRHAAAGPGHTDSELYHNHLSL